MFGSRRGHPLTADREYPPRTGYLCRDHVNVQRPGKNQPRHLGKAVRRTTPQPGRGRCAAMARTWEVDLSESAIRSARFTSPALFALGGMNAWIGQTAGDYLAVSTGLCVCACAAGLFGEDLLQRGYRVDRVVLTFVATHPDSTTRQVARAIRIPQRRVAHHLDRLTDDGLLAVASGGGPRALRSYRLAVVGGKPK